MPRPDDQRRSYPSQWDEIVTCRLCGHKRKGRAVRRAAAAVAACLAAAVPLAGCGGGGRSDSTAAHDLQGLLNDKFGQGTYRVSLCAHSQGNDYQCKVVEGNGMMAGMGSTGPWFVSVVDDGQSISEQGIG